MEEKKEIIRRAAVEVIAERGFHEATTRMIAERAGVAVGTLYNYFHTKEEILAHIVTEERSRRLAFLQRVRETDATAETKLREFLRMHFAQVGEDPLTVRTVLREFRFSEREELQPLMDYFREIPRVIAQILGEDTESPSGRLRGTALFGALQAFTLEMTIFPEEERPRPEDAIECLVDLFIHSRRSRANSTRTPGTDPLQRWEEMDR